MRKNVAVIGGGIAGLCASFAAQDSGNQVTLYESSAVLGGRANGICGRHLVTTAYHDFFKLLDRINSRNKLSLTPLSIGALIKNRKAFWYLAHPLFGSEHPEIGFIVSDILPFIDRLLSIPALYNLKNSTLNEATSKDIAGKLDGTAFRQLPEEKLTEYFHNNKWPQRLLDRFAWPAARSIFNMDPQSASSHLFVLTLKRILEDTEKKSGWVNSDWKSLIADPALETLKDSGVKVKLSSAVTNLRRTKCGWSAKTENGGDSFDAVIVTVPPWKFNFMKDLAEISPLLNAAAEVKGNRIVTISAYYEKADTLPGALCEVEGEQGAWFATSDDKGKVKIERVLSGLDSSEKIDRGKLTENFKSFAESHLNAFNLISEVSIISFNRASPELKPGNKRPLIRQAKGFYYAGDWSATDLPATIESAARAGWIAGELLSEDFTLTCSD